MTQTGSPPTLVGSRLGKFRIVGVLGRGGMGVVYEAEDTILQRPVALKLLPMVLLGGDPKSLERFLLEARSAARLNHPNVVSIYEVGREGQVYYIALELVRGGSADQYLAHYGPMWPQDATRAVMDCAKALTVAHAQNIIHRDIKPSNLIRLASNGSVKLSDFGLAKVAGAAVSSTHSVVGTPQYMSPEQCRNEALDGRADIYSLGATYFCLLTGRPPYDGDSPPQAMYKHCYEPLPDVRAEFPHIPEGCWQVIERAMAKDRQYRIQTPEALLAELSAIDFSGRPQDEPPAMPDWGSVAGADAGAILAAAEQTAATYGPKSYAPPARSPRTKTLRTVPRKSSGTLLVFAAVIALTGLLALAVWFAVHVRTPERTEKAEPKKKIDGETDGEKKPAVE